MTLLSQWSRPGETNTGGATESLFLKQFAGEVLTAFARNTKLMPMFRTRTIVNGYQAQFPVTGRATATYHTPGENILDGADELSASYLNKILHSQVTISVDKPLISTTLVTDWEELVNHYDVRSIYSTQLGEAIAVQVEKNIYRTLIRAARSAATVTGLPAGLTGIASGSNTAGTVDADLRNADLSGATIDGADIASVLFKCAQKMDERFIPKEGRYFLCSPQQYYALAKVTDLVNRDFSQNNGDYAQAKIMEVAGIQIVPCNHAPHAAGATPGDETSGTIYNSANILTPNDYSWVLTSHAGLVVHREAVGTLKLRDIMVESERKIEYQGTLMLAKAMLGHGVLRPECAFELSIA